MGEWGVVVVVVVGREGECLAKPRERLPTGRQCGKGGQLHAGAYAKGREGMGEGSGLPGGTSKSRCTCSRAAASVSASRHWSHSPCNPQRRPTGHRAMAGDGTPTPLQRGVGYLRQSQGKGSLGGSRSPPPPRPPPPGAPRHGGATEASLLPRPAPWLMRSSRPTVQAGVTPSRKWYQKQRRGGSGSLGGELPKQSRFRWRPRPPGSGTGGSRDGGMPPLQWVSGGGGAQQGREGGRERRPARRGRRRGEAPQHLHP